MSWPPQPHRMATAFLLLTCLPISVVSAEVSILFQSAPAAIPGGPSATVVSLVGKVMHLLPDTTAWQRTRLGTRLPGSAQVSTGRRSMVELRLPDGTTYRLGPMSLVRLEAFTPNSAKLDRGGIFARVVIGSVVRVTGAYGTVSVRGTDVAMEIVDGVEYVRVWDGVAEYTTLLGAVTLQPGTGTSARPGMPPMPARPIEPERFSGGQEMPWWEQTETGVEIDAMPDAPSLKQDQQAISASKEQVASTQPSREELATGNLDVIVQGLTKPLVPVGGADISALTAAAAAFATAGAFEGPQTALGKRAFGPYPTAMALGVLGEGGSCGVGRFGLSATVGETYLRGSIGYWAASHTDPDLLLDETYARARGSRWDVLAGRFRILDTPVSNSDYGTLLSYGLYDGVRADFRTGRWGLTLAWLDDYDSLFLRDRSGWYARARTHVWGGSLAVAALRENHAGTGVAAQFSLPLVRDYVDIYGEIGDDPTGQHFETFGLYFPELYQSAGVDLFLERSRRSSHDTLSTMHAYWQLDENTSGLGIIEHSRKYGWRLGIGVLVEMGGG